MIAMDPLTQIILLLAVGVAIIVACQRFHVPSSIGYLLVGVILGPHTAGPTVHLAGMKAVAEFGVVFLLFSIGLNYSLPQLHAMRHQVLGLGTAQVVLSAAVVAVLLWLVGLHPAAAFVIGAVFAQSSSTIIAAQLAEQGEDASPHGRLGLAISVFQDVTAVPFLIVIPVLGAASSAGLPLGELGWAALKAVAAFALVFVVGRRLLRPMFRLITRRRSTELFTLTVLLVALLAAWSTQHLGLSLAFGAFLAGLMIGETEFRHQVESSIRPFRDVLLGLFFVGIGMLIDPAALLRIWHWALAGALLLLISKAMVVALIVRGSGIDAVNACRTALILAVGGEFGFALLAIALEAQVIEQALGQIALASVLFSMVAGALLIRANASIAARLIRPPAQAGQGVDALGGMAAPQVLIGGYGRVGHTIAVLLKSYGVSFVAFDLDHKRVQKGQADGHAVLYGDIADPHLLAAARAEQASLVIITVDDPATALRAVDALRHHCPQVPVIARARDLASSAALSAAGAALAYPEALEASLRLGAAGLKMLRISAEDIDLTLQEIRDRDYQPLAEGGARA